MNNQAFFKVATVVLGLAVVGMIGWSVVKNNPELLQTATEVDATAVSNDSTDSGTKPVSLEDLQAGSFGKLGQAMSSADQLDRLASEASDGTSKSASPSLRIGVIGATPERSDVTIVETLPFTDSEVRRAYRDAGDRACRMLIPGAPLSPARPRIKQGRAGTFGRIATISIGLEMDQAGRSKLPAVVRTEVDKYFRKHRLSVQPILYHDKNGRLYFGTDCQAAFFEKDSPSFTVKCEPMIATAVSRFRALGIVGAASAVSGSSVGVDDAAVLGRTLAMAFTYEKASEIVTTTTVPKLTTELLLFHLPTDATTDNPVVEIYITEDERQTMHKVRIDQGRMMSSTPSISSTVRFGKTVLLGMYPADPIVTSISFRSDGVVSMDSIRRMSAASMNNGTASLSLTEILDQFGQLSKISSPLASSRSTYGDEPSMTAEAVAERRRAIEEQLREIDREVNAKKSEMMSGLGK